MIAAPRGRRPAPDRRPAARVALVCIAALATGCRPHRPGSAAPRALFTDVAASAGVRFDHRNGQGVGAKITETTGTGCAILDYDNDGWPDIYLVNGKSPPGDGNHLFHNNRNGTFADVTGHAGVAALRHDGIGMGCAVGDYDGDGYLDLYVTYWGRNILFHNQGDGTFRDVTAAAGVAAGGFSTAATFVDLDGDGRPDLYVARYCRFTSSTKQLCNTSGVPTSCPPYYYTPEPDFAYRNLSNGHFEDATSRWGLKETTGRGLGVVAVDYNRDGKIDLFVANDGSPNFLYRNQGGHFREVAAEEGIGLDQTGAALANMGCDFGDFLGDGTFGCITGVFQGEVHPLWRYQPGTGFEEMTRRAGLKDATFNMLTFGIGFADLDNDGWLDIFMASGHVQDHVHEIERNCTYRQPRAYFVNTGHGAFVDRSAAGGPAVTDPAVGRGLAFGDLDNDGDIDMVVSNNNGPAMVLRNDHPTRNWVTLRLIGAAPNWEATGAVVDLYAGGRKQTRYLHTNYSYASASDPRVHFGLGSATAVDRVEVAWPDGRKSVHPGVPANRLTTLLEPGARAPGPLRQFLPAP